MLSCSLVLLQLSGAATCRAFSFSQSLTVGLDREHRISSVEKALISIFAYQTMDFFWLSTHTFLLPHQQPDMAPTLAPPELQAPVQVGVLSHLPSMPRAINCLISLPPTEFWPRASVGRFWSFLVFFPLLWDRVSCRDTGSMWLSCLTWAGRDQRPLQQTLPSNFKLTLTSVQDSSVVGEGSLPASSRVVWFGSLGSFRMLSRSQGSGE